MAELSVPEGIQLGLEKLSALNDNKVQALLAALQTTEPALFRRDLIESVSQKVEGIPKRDLDDILEAFTGLFGGAEALEIKPIELISTVLKDADLDLSEERIAALKNTLIEFLNLKSIQVTTKAVDVLLEHEHTFHDARVMTDVRPVFLDDLSAGISTSVIVHTLKLRYHEGRGMKEIFLAMDARDISGLQLALSRAQSKEEILETALNEAKIGYLSSK